MKEKYVQGQLISICIQFSKRKTKYIGRNARNFKKFLRCGSLYRVIFFTGPALKVLSVGDGKIATKKVKV